MDGLEQIIDILDVTLNTKRRRHIAGGMLISISLFFGGLAFTVMTVKEQEKDEERDY